MTAPKRVQMSRQHPWRTDNPDAVIVARPSRWGNPYEVAHRAGGWALLGIDGGQLGWSASGARANQMAVDTFKADIILGDPANSSLSVESIRSELVGRDLACWCKPSQACHGDVLLEIANAS